MVGSRPRARSAFATHVPSSFHQREQIKKRRERDYDVQQGWSTFTDYIAKADVKSDYQQKWSRPSSAIPHRITPFKAKMVKVKNDLLLRKSNLARLIREEDGLYERELQCTVERTKQSDIQSIHARVEELKKEKMTARLNTAEGKRMEMWKRDNPRIRSAEVERRRQDMVDVWTGQLEEQAEVQREKEEERRNRALDAQRDTEMARLEKQVEEENRRKNQATLKQELAQQVSELQRREAEQNQLRNEERDLLSNQARHEQVILEKQHQERQYQQKEMRKLLYRQYRAQILRRAQEVERDLEMDLALLQRIKAEDERERHLEQNKKDNARSLALEGISLLKQKIKEERQAQEEIDDLYRDQASEWWEKREQVWEKENCARQKLLDDILAHRRLQIQEKLEQNKEDQLVVMTERENLISQLETVRRAESEEAQATQQQRDDLIRGLNEQLDLRDARVRQEIDEEEKENETRRETAHQDQLREDQEVEKVFQRPRPSSSVRFAWQ